MQDMVAETLDMERGRKKSETGLDHLERNDFIIQKQEKEKKRLEEEKRKIQSEKDAAKNQARIANEEKDQAEKEANEAKGQAQKARQEKEDAERRATQARSELSRVESKVSEKQTKIDKMDDDINDRSDRLEVLKDEVARTLNEKYSLDYSTGWKDSVLVGLSANLISSDETLGYCINAIQDYACSGLGTRNSGHHDLGFWDEEASVIKRVMTSLAEAFKATLKEIGNWLVWVANQLYKFNDRELHRADKGVNDIAAGGYYWRIQRYEKGNERSR